MGQMPTISEDEYRERRDKCSPSDGSDSIACPHCGKAFEVEIQASLPSSQILNIRLSSEEHSLIGADLLAETISGTRKVLTDTARDLGGTVDVLVKDVRVATGAIDIELLVATVK